MRLALSHWSSRRMLKLWTAGLLLEAALVCVMFAVLVRPEPPLVARLRGEQAGEVRIISVYLDAPLPDTLLALRPAMAAPIAAEDSFYTVLHWPLNKPLLAGGGRVVAVPMRFWWVPALYVGAVPLFLIGTTGIWFWTRRRARSADPAA